MADVKQIQILWCIAVVQSAALMWLWKSQQDSSRYADVARIAEAVSSDSEIEKRVSAMDDDVRRLIIDGRVQRHKDEQRLEEIERGITNAIKLAGSAGALALERKEEEPQPGDFAKKYREEADQARIRSQITDIQFRLDQVEKTLR